MAAKKAKGSSFNKTSTKAASAAYNTKRKVEIAKKALENKKAEMKQTKKDLDLQLSLYRQSQNKGYKAAERAYGENIKYIALEKMPKQKEVKGKISQAVTDRSRSASRAAGIAKRVAKKGK